MHEIQQPPPGQVPRRVPVVPDRGTGVADDAVQIADQHDVAGAAGQFAQVPAGFPPAPQDDPVLVDQHEDPHGQHQHARAARHDQRGPGRGGTGQAVGDDHDGGHGRGQRGDNGRGRRARRPAGPARLGDPPRGRAEQQRRDQGQQLGGDAGMPAQRPLAHAQGVADQNGEQGQVGQHDPPPRGGDHGQQRAEHGQVSQRVDEGEQEGAGPLAGPVELRAEQGHPADHQQGDRHDVTVRQPGQDRGGRALQRAVPVAAGGGGRPAAALPFRRGQHHDADGGGGHGQQRRQVGKRQPGFGAERRAEYLLGDEPGTVQGGGAGQPPVAAGEGVGVPARAEPQAHRRREPRQHAKHAHPRHPETIRRTWAPSVPPCRSY